jgi:dephospho-CoA kinase
MLVQMLIGEEVNFVYGDVAIRNDGLLTRDQFKAKLISIVRGSRKLNIVAFAGKSGAGKDTAASALRYSSYSTTLTFAGPLKRAIAELFGLTNEHLYGDKRNTPVLRNGWSARKACQWLGTDMVRNTIDKDNFIRRMDMRLLEQSMESNVLITDVRFDNEVDLIREYGGVIVKIIRPDQEEDAGSTEHESENGVTYSDYTVINNASLVEFENAIVKICKPLFCDDIRQGHKKKPRVTEGEEGEEGEEEQ